VNALLRGPFKAIRRARNRVINLWDPPILVLAYHRVADLAEDAEELAVKPERFRLQMRAIRASYDLLRLGQSWPRGSRPAAIVTFDDGYADNATTALPILEEEEVPATFFVTTGAVERGAEFWWDELARRVLDRAEAAATLELGQGPARRSWPVRTRDERAACYRDLHEILRRLLPEPRERFLAEIRAARGGGQETRASHRPLTVDEVARLGKSEWAAVGAHGVTHTPFSKLSLDAQRGEMTESRERLRAWTGTEIDTFSFPFGGRRDFSKESVRLARAAGFRRIAANVPGQARRRSDPFLVPRFLVRDWDAERFLFELRRFEVA
jgi:peptidoglycan/xylan/chitin deacetylase (PgdA/CDA1 family)